MIGRFGCFKFIELPIGQTGERGFVGLMEPINHDPFSTCPYENARIGQVVDGCFPSHEPARNKDESAQHPYHDRRGSQIQIAFN